MENQEDIFLKIGRQVVDSAHQHFWEHHLDNAEYILILKSLITGLETLASETISPPRGLQIGQTLRDYGHQLFDDC